MLLLTEEPDTSEAACWGGWNATVACQCLCRKPRALRWRVAPHRIVVRGDLLSRRPWARIQGVETAFYLVHSMQPVKSSKPRSVRRPPTSRWRPARQGYNASSTWVGWRRRRTLVSHEKPRRDRKHPAIQRHSRD